MSRDGAQAWLCVSQGSRAREQEVALARVSSERGRALELRAAGVKHPERVRVLRVAQVPHPEDPDIVAAAHAAGMFFSHTAGTALRYGIFLLDDLFDPRMTLAHELTHTAQYERLGGFEVFLRQYLTECLTVGYFDSPLEREAVATAERVG